MGCQWWTWLNLSKSQWPCKLQHNWFWERPFNGTITLCFMKHTQWESSHRPPVEDSMTSNLSLSGAHNKKAVPGERELIAVSLGDIPPVCFALPKRQAQGVKFWESPVFWVLNFHEMFWSFSNLESAGTTHWFIIDLQQVFFIVFCGNQHKQTKKENRMFTFLWCKICQIGRDRPVKQI